MIRLLVGLALWFGSHLFKQYQTELQYTKDGILKMTLNDHPSEPGHVENRE
mgnify:CR=1 FL=1